MIVNGSTTVSEGKKGVHNFKKWMLLPHALHLSFTGSFPQKTFMTTPEVLPIFHDAINISVVWFKVGVLWWAKKQGLNSSFLWYSKRTWQALCFQKSKFDKNCLISSLRGAHSTQFKCAQPLARKRAGNLSKGKNKQFEGNDAAAFIDDGDSASTPSRKEHSDA